MKTEVFEIKEAPGGAKGGGGSAHTPVEQRDSLVSLSKIRMLIALGEGVVKGGLNGQRIFLNGTPLMSSASTYNYPEVKWEFRPGTATQDIIGGFPAIERPTQLGGLALEQAQPWLVELTDTSIDALRLRLGFPYMSKTEDNGDTNGTRVDYTIEVSTDGGQFQLVASLAAIGKCTSLYERDHRIDLPRATTKWQVRVTRKTADSTSQTLQNKTQIQGYTEVTDLRLRYPNTALLYVEFDAKTFPQMPKVSCLLEGREVQVPSNYDPDSRAYVGQWNGQFKWAYTNNPAWILYDIATQDRFGLGHLIKPDMLPKYVLYAIAQRCDQLVPDGNGGMEPRFTYNGYIQGQAAAWDALRDITASFNGASFWANGMLNVTQDAPADVKQIITRADVVGGRFSYAGGSQKNRYSVAIVSASDPSNHYNDIPVPVTDLKLQKRYGHNPIQTTAIGCTSVGQAQRRGKYILLTNSLDRAVSFKMGLGGINFLPGTIIALADERISGKVMGGQITAIDQSLRVLTLDRKTDAKVSDSFLVRTKDSVAERRTISVISADGMTITLSTALTGKPVPGAVFVIDAADLHLQQFRVQSMAPVDGEDCFEIKALIHNESKYDAIDHGARIDIPVVSHLPVPGLPAPGNIKISSYEAVAQQQRITTMRVEWDKVDGALSYEAQWRRDDNDWVNVAETSAQSFEVSGIYAGRYAVRVRSIGLGNVSSAWSAVVAQDLTGRQGKPPKPLAFTATPLLWGIQLDWAFGNDTADTSYTEILMADNDAGNNERPLTNVIYPAATYQQTGLKPGQGFWYKARLVDRNGNQSDWTDYIRGIANSDGSDYLDAIGGDFLSADDGQALMDNFTQSLEAAIHNTLNLGGTVERQFAAMGNSKAEIVIMKQTVAKIDSALSQLETQVETEVDGITAALNDKLTAMVDANKASAIHTLKAGVRIDGIEYNAGMSIAVIAENGKPIVTRLGFNANQFVLMSGEPGSQQYSPFAVVNGAVFIDSAFIQDASITGAKIKNATIDRAQIVELLSSENYIAGQRGIALNFKTGVFEMNGSVSGQGRMALTNNRLVSYDGSGNPTAVVGQRL